MKQKSALIFLALLFGYFVQAQNSYLTATSENSEKVYSGENTYAVETFPQNFKSKKPKNIVFLIGDGMGTSQIFAGLTANHGHLFLENCKYVGFSKTQSVDNYITDSAAGGTALSSGVKTFNGAIGVDVNKKPVKTILEEAEEKGFATGLVSTSAITHATPASFIAHQISRNMYEEIAADFLKTDIDVFIGGGLDHFTKRKDGKNLVQELEQKGYAVETSWGNLKNINKGPVAGLLAPLHMGRVSERGDILPKATDKAIEILDKNKKGFFLMVEGSQIDWGGHANSTVYIVEDMLDFDQTIGEVLKFATNDGETLVVITADHETGGIALTGGNITTGEVKADFPIKDHTAVMVPVFAYGPGAEEFTGIMENTEIHNKMKKLLLD